MRHYLVLVCISRVRYFLKSRWAAAIYITTIIATFIVGHKIQDTCLQRPWTVEVFRIVLAFSSQLSCFLSSTILVLRVYHKKIYIFGVSNWPPKNLIWKRTYWYAEAQAKMHQPVHFLIRAKYNKSKLSFVQWIIVLYISGQIVPYCSLK